MNKKLMVAVTAGLMVLVQVILPTFAYGGDYTADCETGAQCSMTVSFGALALSDTSGETISCTSISGTATQTSGSSTGTVQMMFHGCRETVTIFRFPCTSPGQPSGTITTNTMVTHLINIEPSGSVKTPGVLFTGANVTFGCRFPQTLTGDLIGPIENPNCGSFSASHSLIFEATSHGQQKYKQVTTTGAIHDLITSNHSGGEYKTFSMIATSTLTYGTNKLKITC